MVQQAETVYHVQKSLREVKDYDYTRLKKVMDKSPFSLLEWADMLHISERTLHRYAKENNVFNGLQTERILLVEKLIDAANNLFGKEGFASWLNDKPFSLGGVTVKELLRSHDGIQALIDLTGRMQYGISA